MVAAGAVSDNAVGALHSTQIETLEERLLEAVYYCIRPSVDEPERSSSYCEATSIRECRAWVRAPCCPYEVRHTREQEVKAKVHILGSKASNMLDELELPPLQVVVEQPPQPRAMALAVRVPCVLRLKPLRK